MNTETQNDGQADRASNGGPLLTGLLIGGLVGAASMLLLAPQAGRKTRQEIQAGAMDIRDRTTNTMKGTVSEARSRARELASNMSDRVDELEDQGKDFAIGQLGRVSNAALAAKRAVEASKNG